MSSIKSHPPKSSLQCLQRQTFFHHESTGTFNSVVKPLLGAVKTAHSAASKHLAETAVKTERQIRLENNLHSQAILSLLSIGYKTQQARKDYSIMPESMSQWRLSTTTKLSTPNFRPSASLLLLIQIKCSEEHFFLYSRKGCEVLVSTTSVTITPRSAVREDAALTPLRGAFWRAKIHKIRGGKDRLLPKNMS